MNHGMKFLTASLLAGGLVVGCEDEPAVTEVEREPAVAEIDREPVETVRPEVAEGVGEVQERAGEVGQEIGEGAAAVGEGVREGVAAVGEGAAELGEETEEAVGAAAEIPGEMAATEREGIATAIAGTTEAAIGDLNQLGNQLTEADRGRFGNIQPNQQYTQAVEQFRQAWQTRYNQEFDIGQPQQVYGEQFGQITPMGQNRVQVQLQSTQGLPPATATFVRENNQWRLDPQDQIDPQQFQQTLAQQLTQLTQTQDQWPEDPAQAQRLVGQAVLTAAAGPAQGAGAQQGVEPLPQPLPPAQPE